MTVPKARNAIAHLVRGGKPAAITSESPSGDGIRLEVATQPVSLQQRVELLIERVPPMMLTLSCDISRHRFQLRRTHREHAISFLPRKPVAEKPRRIGFDLLDCNRCRHFGGN